MLDLESAIKHCEEVVESCERGNPKKRSKAKCASEHRQLAKWLRELVHLRNITEYLRDKVTCFEFMGSMHYNEDIIEWADEELSVDMREANADDSN